MSDFNSRPQIEILSAADGERRRYWSDDDKLRIVEESFIGHRQGAATARRHGICRSLLTIWRRQYRNGELGAGCSTSFAPVTVAGEIPASQPVSADPFEMPRSSRIEIVLANGRRLIVPNEVGPEALGRILAVVDGQ